MNVLVSTAEHQGIHGDGIKQDREIDISLMKAKNRFYLFMISR